MGKDGHPHPGHERHLCHLQNTGFILKNWEEYKSMVKNPRYICRVCGRMAGESDRLCAPEKV